MQRVLILAAALGLSLAPVLAFAAPNQSPQNPSASPSTGTIPDGTIGKAGAALHDVAKVQERYQGKFESATPDQKKGLTEQANAEAVQAIQSHGLSVQEYSNVVRTAQSDPHVKQRLLDAANNDQ